MIKTLKQLEKNLGYKCYDDTFCLAIDTATKSGIAFVCIFRGKLKIYTYLLGIPALPKDMEDKSEKYVEHLEKFYTLISENLIPKVTTDHDIYIHRFLVLENSFLKMNVVTFGFLRALQGIVFALLRPHFHRPKIIFPTTARKMVGFQSHLGKGAKPKDKKKEIMKWISNIIEEPVKDDNIADALLLAFAGLKKEN